MPAFSRAIFLSVIFAGLFPSLTFSKEEKDHYLIEPSQRVVEMLEHCKNPVERKACFTPELKSPEENEKDYTNAIIQLRDLIKKQKEEKEDYLDSLIRAVSQTIVRLVGQGPKSPEEAIEELEEKRKQSKCAAALIKEIESRPGLGVDHIVFSNEVTSPRILAHAVTDKQKSLVDLKVQNKMIAVLPASKYRFCGGKDEIFHDVEELSRDYTYQVFHDPLFLEVLSDPRKVIEFQKNADECLDEQNFARNFIVFVEGEETRKKKRENRKKKIQAELMDKTKRVKWILGEF